MSQTIAVVTGEDKPELTDGAQELCAELRTRGHVAEPAVWTDSTVDWQKYDVALIRSCWRYYTKPQQFLDLLDSLAADGVTVLNAPDAVRWNHHKSYLADLQQEGISVVPTEFVPADHSRDLSEILRERGWDKAVVKPAIGTSAAGVWTTTQETAREDQTQFEGSFSADRKVGDTAGGSGGELSQRGTLVQPFVPEVADGELSLVFFGGEFSYAWRSIRSPDALGVAPNEESDDGLFDPPSWLRQDSRDVLQAAGRSLDLMETDFVYARVDGVVRDGSFLLMELELIEPYLRLSHTEAGVSMLADAIETAV